MIITKGLVVEAKRGHESLRQYFVVDTPWRKALDDLMALMSTNFEIPSAVISETRETSNPGCGSRDQRDPMR
jgi:hypothetical protein